MEQCGDRMNGGTRITSGGGKEKNVYKTNKENATSAAAFVKRCQIFNPGVLSVLLSNR